jgi:hypothetical protein
MPDEQMVRLVAPPGTDEANFGTTRYRVGDDRTIVVPARVAADLVHGAGFAMAPVQPVPPPDVDAANEVTADAELTALGDPQGE